MANTVLIIESDKATIAQAKAVAEAAGYRFLFAETAADGLSTATGQGPSIIFVNLATPGTNGLEICKTLHNTEPLANVPIILITLREGKFDPVYKKLYGIVSFLKKPFTDDEMSALIQEHSPLTEEAPAEEEEPQGFEEMELEAGAEEEAGAVFSIDDAQASLQDLQSNFQQPLDEEEAPSTGEADEFEGTRAFSMEQEEEAGGFGEVEPGGFGEAGGGEEEAGGFGEVEPGGFGEAGGGEEGAGGFSEAGGVEEEAGGFGEVEPGGFGEAGGGEEEAGGFGEAGGGEEETGGFGEGEEDESWGEAGGDEEAGESFGFGDEEEAGQTMKIGGAEDGTAVMDSDSFDWGAAEEEAEKTMAMGKVAPVPQAKKPQKMEESMPSFDDESQQADESFLDESMGGEEMPQMDTEEDYSDLFEGGAEEKGKPKGKETKPKKGAAKGGSGLKRILVLFGIIVVVAGLGFAGYMFFMAPEPPKPATVELPKPRVAEPRPAPSPVEQPAVPAEPAAPAAKAGKTKPEPAAPAEKPAKPSRKASKAAPPVEETVAAMPGEVGAGYYVQFGVFKSEANASRMITRVAEYGLKTVIFVKDGKNFVLLDETLSSYKAGTKRAQEVKTLTGFDTAVYRKK